MKNIFTLLVLTVSLLLTNNAFSQAPQLVNYQAVARDLSGNPLITTPVNIVFDVLQGSSSGTLIYSETYVSSTNQFGLFTAEIGGGTPVFGTFSGINWSLGIYYLRVTINGDVMTGTQLLSVPYALHAKTAASGMPGANGHANLADSVAEPVGINCPNGGYLIYMGVDDNDDNILQPLERDIQYYICNGLDGSANNNDTSATNELQTLSISNDTIFLTNGGFVVLPSSSGGLWNTNAQGIDYVVGNVGVGTSTPVHKLTINSSDSIIASFTGNNPGASIIGISNTNPGATIGTIFLSGTDTAIIALDPAQKLLGISNNINGGHIGISSDSTITSYARVISNVAQDFVYNNSDSIFNISPTGNIININQGTFVTDSLYLIGNNKDSTNWILANDGFGQAKWTNPNSLGLGGSLWQSNSPDIYFNTGNVGVGTLPSHKFHVSGGNPAITTIALFERAGFFGATIDVNATGSNSAGIKLQNGGTTTGSIISATSGEMSITATKVGIGGPASGKLHIANSSTTAIPTLQLHETSSGFSRIKHTNTVANKYWIVEAGLNAVDATSGYSIAYNNGVTNKIPFIVYGDSKVGINNIAPPLSSFHVMDDNTVGNGIISEGFNQPGLLVAARNNFTSPNRGAIVSGDLIGQIAFPGHHSSGFGGGPQIYAKATENFTSSSFGSEIIFNTIMNGTTTNVQALRLLNDGRAEFPVGLLIPTGAGANKILTSDASGNASWQTPSFSSSNDTSIIDADGDTYINLEAAPDQDVIHFNLGNSTGYTAAEYFTMIGPRFEVINSGNSVFIGQGAGLNDDLTNNLNTFIGHDAGNSNTTGVENVALGSAALLSNVSGGTNTAIGREALRLNTGGSNTAVGFRASQNNTTGVFNSSLGYEVLRLNSTGNRNSAFGTASLQNSTGSNNSSFGADAGITLTSGNNNTFIGKSADAGIANLTNATAIGANSVVSANNSLVLGGIGANSVNVGIGTTSPIVSLHVAKDGQTIIAAQSFNNNVSDGSSLALIRSRGTAAVPAGVQNGDRLGKLEFIGMDNAFNLSEAVSIRAFADETFGSTAHGSHLEFHTTPIGIGVSNEAMRIAPNGNIGIGTGIPSAKLDVNGTFKLTDGTEGAGKILTSDASGFATWKTRQVAFEAHVSGLPSLSLGALQFGTVFFDDGANYNSATSVFTAPVNGIYSFNLSVMAIVSLSNGSLNVTLRKNGLDNKEQTAYLTSGQPNNITFVTTMRLAAGDTIDIRVNSAPAGTSVQSSAGTWFSGHLVYAN